MSKVKKKKKHIGLIIALVVLAVIVIVAVGISVGLSKTFLMKHPELEGEPEVGKWYRITPETAKSSNGTEWHGILRKGSENKLVVYFFGGGVSITEETSKGGKEFYAEDMTGQDYVATWGIGSNDASNPFKDWSFLVIPYASGDFHMWHRRIPPIQKTVKKKLFIIRATQTMLPLSKRQNQYDR